MYETTSETHMIGQYTNHKSIGLATMYHSQLMVLVIVYSVQ